MIFKERERVLVCGQLETIILAVEKEKGKPVEYWFMDEDGEMWYELACNIEKI